MYFFSEDFGTRSGVQYVWLSSSSSSSHVQYSTELQTQFTRLNKKIGTYHYTTPPTHILEFHKHLLAPQISKAVIRYNANASNTLEPQLRQPPPWILPSSPDLYETSPYPILSHRANKPLNESSFRSFRRSAGLLRSAGPEAIPSICIIPPLARSPHTPTWSSISRVSSLD